jgi:CheY-like chemotaxis protein
MKAMSCISWTVENHLNNSNYFFVIRIDINKYKNLHCWALVRIRACVSIHRMSEPLPPDDHLGGSVSGRVISASDTEALPHIEGVPASERPALSHADGKPLDLDSGLDLDLDYASAAVNQLAQHPEALTPVLPALSPVYQPEATHHPVPILSGRLAADAGGAPAGARLQPRMLSGDPGRTFEGTCGFPWQDRRVLLVSVDAQERIYLRTRLSLAKLVWVDEAASTTQAETAMNAHRYTMAIFNLDAPGVDGLALVRFFRRTQPDAVCVVTGARSPLSGPLGLWGRWRQWQREKELNGTGVEWLDKPLIPKKVTQLFTRVHRMSAYKNSKH